MAQGISAYQDNIRREDLIDIVKDISPTPTPIKKFLKKSRIQKLMKQKDFETLRGFKYLLDMETQAVLSAQNKHLRNAIMLGEYLKNKF